MKTKVSTMVAPGSLLVFICAVLVYSAGLGNSAPTELRNINNESVQDGAHPTMVPPQTNDAKLWPPQKPSRSKHITKSNLYKKPTKDKGGRVKGAGEKPFFSPPLVSTGYDVEKDNLSRHKEASSTGTVVDNGNGPKNYTNKTRTNTITLQHSIPPHSDTTESSSTNVDDDDDVVDGTGKDIDFISIAGTTKSDETYATATATTEGYHAKAGVASAASTTATMQTSLVENPNFNAKPIAKMSTKSPPLQDIKSISSSTVALTPTSGKSLPANASVSSSLSLSFTQSTVLPKLVDVGHDGVKITKKKQLFDKHFIAAVGPSALPSGSLHLPITKDNPRPLSKNKPTKSGKKLMEVPNGYLGPIMMKEKTFSVSHHGKKPKPSILEQLRDKKLVEIIAPTALMEPTIKVKSSVPPPEFVPIDSASSVRLTTSTTTSAPTRPSPLPTVATSKEEEIESETVTTYFLVLAQDSKSPAREEISEKPSTDTEMQPMNAGEIETTLREIYTEVLNAMEGASKKKSSSTVVPKINEDQDEGSTRQPTTDYSHSSNGDHPSFANQLRFSDSVPSAATDQYLVQSTDLMKEFNSDRQRSSYADHPSIDNQLPSISTEPDQVTDHVLSSVTDRVQFSDTDHLPSSVSDHFRFPVTDRGRSLDVDDGQQRSSGTDRVSPIIDRVLPLVTDRNSIPIIDLGTQGPTSFSVTYHDSSSQLPSFAITSERVIIVDQNNLSPTTNDASTTTDRSSTPSSMIYGDFTTGTLIKDDASAIIDGSSMFSHHESSANSRTTSIPMKDHSLLPTTDGTPTFTEPSSTSSLMVHHDTSTKMNAISIPEKDQSLPSIAENASKITDYRSKGHSLSPTTDNIPTIPDLSFTVQSLSPSTDGTPMITDRSSTSSLIFASIKDHSLSPITDDASTITDRSSTSSPLVHHDSSAGPSSTTSPISDMGTSTYFPVTTRIADPTLATITTDSYTISPTVYQPSLKPTHDSEQTESKISDIQIEVYDSTVEPILAATNFKDNSDVHRHTTIKQAPSNSLPQERFTQYVVDKAADFATQDSNSVAKASGKPEPAAIEIHINVSEGFGNESEDLEFSYRQSDYRKVTSKKPANTNFITLKPFDVAPQNETSNEAAEEIVVEIIDGNLNSTENSASRENLNVNPIFIFRSDDDSQVELKNVKYYPEDSPKERKKSTDDFFVAHVGQQSPGLNKPMTDRDSDTIFYISNTEVKVGESLPTTNTYDAQLKKSRLESQFFPANYEERQQVPPQRYEEDIILSPLKNRISDPLKVVRGPLDISYVGESVMEVEQVTVTTTIAPPITGSTPDVIIQPAVLPEMAIGVPVIGELPPQIELKEIDFMPNFDGNREDSSIQYGGDLIDEGGAMGAGFDMDSYPLGLGQRNDAISSQMVLSHRVNHLKKDELSADLAASSETTDGNDLLHRSNDSVNGTVIGEKMGNATAYSVMEEPPAGRELHFADLHTLFMACLATLLPLILSVVMAFGLRHLYHKYQTNPFNIMGRNSSTDPLDAEKGTGGDGDGDGVETPEELRASSLAFGATTDSPSLEIITSSNEVTGKASDGDGRDCNGCIANGRAAASDLDVVDCIQAIIPDNFQEENAIFIVNCNTEAQPTTALPPTIQPQSSTTTTTIAAATPTAGTMQCNYSGANGSITTMTLKNNHLIVETEERNDISRDARETKMHYNNSEKDGVFVVEVSRGADSKIMPGSPIADPANKRPFNVDAAVKIAGEDNLQSNHEEVQIHPPPPENVNIHGEIESNHLHQIDEVDEFEEGPKISKHSNTGLSQSDLSSSSSVDSNKRYSYGNQELYTIEQQDYTTPSPAATKAPHPHVEQQPPQPENHNDGNGHSENGHVLENGPSNTPNCDSIYPADTDSDVNGHNGVESKPKITAALLKQDTVIVNEMTNGLSHNGHEEDDDEATSHNSMENLSNGLAPTIIETCNIVYGDNTENGFDSIISLPDPPSTEEMKQMNDIILMETNQLDSLPPPPPPGAENHQHHNGNGIAPEETDNGDSHSIVSSTSPMNTPTKVMSPPTITVAAAAPNDIPHTNGNCMTGHTTTSTATVVEVSGSS